MFNQRGDRNHGEESLSCHARSGFGEVFERVSLRVVATDFGRIAAKCPNGDVRRVRVHVEISAGKIETDFPLSNFRLTLRW